MLRIAVVAGNMEADPEEQARLSAFRRQLAGLGWLEGHSIRFDYRWAATDEDRIRSTVAELVSLKPDAILTQGTPLTVAAQQQTRTIPIVLPLSPTRSEAGWSQASRIQAPTSPASQTLSTQ
jgi:putative tryptophan/tyrosine transport system substrate-binding protein